MLKPSELAPVTQCNRPRLTDVLANECCQPSCDFPAQQAIETEVPLCEKHMLDVYRAAHAALVVHRGNTDEYVLLPSESEQIPGPCVSCGHTGYLSIGVDRWVRCINASCGYEAPYFQFNELRRNLLSTAAGESSVIYYIRFRDCIKIGTTTNLKNRCTGLGSVESLYGFELGAYQLEQLRHKQFHRYRMRGEWFEDHPAIRAHINQVCSRAA